MRLSADVISQAEQRSNPLGEREIVLRGLAIPGIEHLGATRDLFDTIDFADNRITRLENFPRMLRLSSLHLSGNSIESVDGKNMGKNLPNLVHLVLTDNRISGLHEVGNIASGCRKLEHLTLTGNPVTRRQHYRLYTINKIPTLKILDFVKIKKSEREKANRLAMSAAGAALEGDVQIEARDARRAGLDVSDMHATNTFNPGEGRSAKDSFVVNFTPDEKDQIKEMIANASSPAEIERIEEFVKKGEFPVHLNGDGMKRSCNDIEGVNENGKLSKRTHHNVLQNIEQQD